MQGRSPPAWRDLAVRLSLVNVARMLGSWPNRVSELERGVRYDTDLALRYRAMLAGINSTTAGIDNAA